MAKGRLRGGDSSTGPHRYNPAFESHTRQRRRRASQLNAHDHMRVKYAGVGRSGGTAWSVGMPRRVARAIALVLARKHWRLGIDVQDGPRGVEGD